MSKCKHGRLEWVGEGDRRLICRKCGAFFILVDGIPVEVMTFKYERKIQ